MKFQQILALQKHITTSFASKQIPKSYLVIHPQREERRRLAEKISALTKAFVSFHEGCDWDTIYYKLSTGSLFSEEEVVVWDAGKNLDEMVIEKICRYMQNPSPYFFLIIGVESAKGIGALLDKTKQGLIVLDASEEKPWDKDKRMQQELYQEAKNLGKTVTPAALARMLAACGGDSFFAENELAKLVAYVGDRPSIGEEDVLAVGACSATSTNWQIAESFVWEGKFSYPEMDNSLFLALVAQIRFLLQQARQVGWLVQEKKQEDEIAKITGIRSNQLTKILDRLKKRKMEYFDRALELVYAEELRAKNSHLPARFLFDYLLLQMTQLKKVCFK